MTFSALISGTIPHHGKYGLRPGAVTRVIEHHWAGMTGGIERLSNPNQKASCTYLVLSDGRILGQVPEEFRPWTSGGPAADNSSITIECQNSSVGPEWRVSDAAMAAIVRLLADIATRHHIALWTPTTYRGHREFAATACPGPYLWPRLPEIRAAANALLTGGVQVGNPVSPVEPPSLTVKPSLTIRNEQAFLNAARGEKLVVDGLKGPLTTAAYKRYQEFLRTYGYHEAIDGLWGPGTQAAHEKYYRAWSGVPATKPNCSALQRAMRTTADNSWGPLTDKHGTAIREASFWGGHDFPWGVAFTQGVVGTAQDSSWGPKSIAAHDATVRAMQVAMRDMGFNPGTIDGTWGPASEAAYLAARRACHI